MPFFQVPPPPQIQPPTMHTVLLASEPHLASAGVVNVKTSLKSLPPIDADKVLSTFLDLVKLPSPSGQEELVRAYVETRLAQMGLTPAYHVDKAGNIILKIPSNVNSNRTVLITAHMDVVPPCLNVKPVVEGKGNQRVIRSSGDTILGGDDKAALSSLLEALELSLKAHWPRPNLIIPITVREEIGGFGAAEMDPAEYQHADVAIALDCNDVQGTVVTAAPQITLMEIAMHGKSAHSGFEPEKGINALKALLIGTSQFRLGRLDEVTTANLGTFTSGKKFNIVPDLAIATGEVRSLSRARVEEEFADMKQKLDAATQQVPGTHYDWKQQTVIKSYQTDLNQPIFNPLKETFVAEDVTLRPIKTNGGSDVNVFADTGIPSVVLSGAYYNPHQVNEYVKLQDMVTLTRLLLRMMENYSRS